MNMRATEKPFIFLIRGLVRSLNLRFISALLCLALAVQLGRPARAADSQKLLPRGGTPQGMSASDWASIVQQMPLIAQEAYLKASNTDGGDFFGYSVAVSGDTVVVGAPSESSNNVGGESDNS